MTGSQLISDALSSILPAIEHFRMLGYWIALAAALLETTVAVGLVLPGSTIILFLGFLAAQGRMDIGDLVWFAAAGAVLGDNVNYFFGRKYGERWFRDGIWFLSHEHFVKARAMFDSHGGKSVFLGRFVPGIKEIAPIVAGLVGMNRSRFFFWNVLGAVGWSLEFLLTGYLAGHSMKLAGIWISRIGFFVAIFIIAGVLLAFLRRWLYVRGQAVFGFALSVFRSLKSAVAENPEVGRLIKAHPAFFRFLAERLDREKLSGLPLTLFSFSLIFLCFLFAGVVEDLISRDPIVFADVRTAHLLAVFRSPGVTRFFTIVTLLGKWQVATAMTAAFLGALWLAGKRSYAGPLLVSILVSESLTTAAKLAFHRPRPDVMLYVEHSYSFPSGHSTIAVSLYCFMAYAMARSSATWKAKSNFAVAGLAVALLIGFSRLYLGEHYLSDVWGGYLIGALGLFAAIGLREWMAAAGRGPGDLPRSGRETGAALVVMAAAVVFYAGFTALYQPPLVPVPGRAVSLVGDLSRVFDNGNLIASETITGEKDLPISFVIAAGDDLELAGLFSRAGWIRADRANPASLYKMGVAMLRDRPYPAAPVSPSFWDFRVSEFGFEKPISGTVRKRFRASVWKAPFSYGQGDSVYVGTVSLEDGTKWLLTRKMSPDIDAARDVLIKDLAGTGSVAWSKMFAASGKSMGENFTGDPYYTDGRVFLSVLGQTPLKPAR